MASSLASELLLPSLGERHRVKLFRCSAACQSPQPERGGRGGSYLCAVQRYLHPKVRIEICPPHQQHLHMHW
jgi:hypothetical protein